MALSSGGQGGGGVLTPPPLYTPQAGGGRRRQNARSTAQLYSAVSPSGPRGAGGGRRQDQSRQALDSLADGRGGLRSQTPPGPRCPPRHESPTRGGNCSPAPSAVAALSAPPLLPAPAGRVRRGAVSGVAGGEPRAALEDGGTGRVGRAGTILRTSQGNTHPAARNSSSSEVARLGPARRPLAMLSAPRC